MSALHAEVYEAFRVLDVPDDKALKTAVALSAALMTFEADTVKAFDRRDADIEAIRGDVSSMRDEIAGINTRLAALQGEMDVRFTSAEASLDRGISSLEGSLDKRISSMQGDMTSRLASMQGEINLLKWMMGTTIALLVTVLFRVFTH